MYNKIQCKIHKDEGINAYINYRKDGTKQLVVVCFVCNAALYEGFVYLNNVTVHGEEVTA